ncbi:MAG: helix-turn-helix transcriptional regulator [Oscillospiraceae bacterium]|nr:helix-turn-helix transcriptional regulator [Oscillospiraceae bacterium]
MNLADKLKKLRKNKNVSQEKFAEYLGVSYQAVSKWENNITSPDILLLPDIARYFGITVDELLQVEQIEADKYFEECSLKAETLFRDGKCAEIIPLWLEAYKKLPNDIRVKEMLMSIYFDTDKVKYQNEIIELGTEIYNYDAAAECNSYYKGQAINEVAQTYYANGNYHKADEWARKAYQINHCQEKLFMQIHDEEDWLTDTFSFANHWYMETLFYMSMRLNSCNVKCFGDDYVQKVNKSVVNMFEVVYPNDDMSYESLQHLCILHRCIAEDEISLDKDEALVKKHLTRAVECAVKAINVKAHDLAYPLVCGWKIADAPSDNMQIMRTLKDELTWECFEEYRQKDWFIELNNMIDDVLFNK